MQRLAFGTGLVLFFIVSQIDYKFIAKFYWLIYALNIGLLMAVILIGDAQQGADVTRQLTILGQNIQPSQFSKIFMIIFLATFVEKYNDRINNPLFIILLGGLVLLPVILVQRQPSLSASLVVAFVSMVIIFVSGISYKYVFAAVSITFPLLTVGGFDIIRGSGNTLFIHNFMAEYQIDRVAMLLQRDIDNPLFFQNRHSLHALGSGQLTGKGLYNGTVNQLNALPEAHNDFIFAVIGEEFGFIGANLVLILMLILIIKCIKIAYFASTQTGKLIAIGAASMLFFHTFIHVGVVTNVLPNTGISLPFISYGGSSMWVMMATMGMVMNVHNNSKPKSFFEEES